MPKVSSIYGSTYMSGVDVGDKTYRLQVDRVDVGKFDDGDKLVVSFINAKKGLVLNKTNASALVAAWSDDTDEWADRWLEAFTVPTQFNGRTYDAIRVRPVAETAKLAPPVNGDGPAAVVGVPAGQGKAARQAAADNPSDIPF